jgi:hypothetical protein
LDILSGAIEDGFPVDILFTDFLKAFDKVCHRLLIFKLEKYGIGGRLLDWLKDFLSDRKQRVVIGEQESSWKEVYSGVPQGSVLGPLLFIIYINDLLENLINQGKLYADDSKVICILRDPEAPQSLQDDIGKLIDWTTKWKMAFNCSKCKRMHVGRKNPSFDYQMTDTVNDNVHTLECSTEERDLGIFVTENLKWSTHCHIASAKGNKALEILRNTFTRPSVDTMKKLYCCYVRPHLEFAVPVF